MDSIGDEQMELTIGDQLNYLVHEVDGDKVAHCLDFDLVGIGKTNEDAIDALNTLVVSTILFALKSESVGAIVHAAPRRYWEMFEEASKSGTNSSTLDIPNTKTFAVSECHYTYRWAVAA